MGEGLVVWACARSIVTHAPKTVTQAATNNAVFTVRAICLCSARLDHCGGDFDFARRIFFRHNTMTIFDNCFSSGGGVPFKATTKAGGGYETFAVCAGNSRWYTEIRCASLPPAPIPNNRPDTSRTPNPDKSPRQCG